MTKKNWFHIFTSGSTPLYNASNSSLLKGFFPSYNASKLIEEANNQF